MTPRGSTATAARETVAGPPRISNAVGCRGVDIRRYRFVDSSERNASFSLLMSLGACCGSADDGGTVLSAAENRDRWITLAEADPAEVRRIVARIERTFGWRLPGEGPIVDRIDRFFAERFVG